MKKIYLSKVRSQIARHSTIRDINKQIVLNFVRVRSPISRAEIARETSLQRSTVSSIVDALQEAELVEEVGTGDSTGGRRPTMLKLRTGKPVAVGVDVAPRTTSIVVADLAGTILSTESFKTSPDVEFMTDEILRRTVAVAESNSENDLQVGLCVPGVADTETGNVVLVPYFNWSDWDIGRRVAKETSLKVFLDNDANSVALAELWLGAQEIRQARNFITVMVAEGIGTGIVINGEIYRGEDGAAGEFGHMFVAEDAPVACSCGRRDCWEAHASEKAMLAKYGNSPSVSMEQLIRNAEAGDVRALSVLRETATFMGIGISNLIMGFSPKTVIVSGRITRAWNIIQDEILSYGRRSIRQDIAGATIIPSTLGDSPTILGSISLVLVRKFGSAL